MNALISFQEVRVLFAALHQVHNAQLMICPECRAKQVTILNDEAICTKCGAVLSESFVEENANLADRSEQEQPPVTAGVILTRAEKRFFESIDRFAAALGLTDWIHYIRQVYYVHNSALTTFRTRYSDESAICLIYIATRSGRTGHTLAEYASKVGVTDVKELNKAFKRYSKAVKTLPGQRVAAAASSSSLSPSPPSVPQQADESMERVSTVVAKLYHPISTMFGLQDENAVALSDWTKRVYDIAKRAGLETGRPTGPLITACVVVAARTLSSRLVDVDWVLLSQNISYGCATIRHRSKELMDILVRRAKSIPWLKNSVITKFNVHHYLCEIIQMDSSINVNDRIISVQQSQLQPSLESYPPSYRRNYERIQHRASQIAAASQYLNRPTIADSDLLSMNVEVRMIYFLLAKGMSASDIEVLDSQHIYDHVRRLYIRDTLPALSQEDLNRSEVSEKDMDDIEAAQYLQSDPSSTKYDYPDH
ncbi:hypothetical protein BDB00DRAFT_941826 [Zychaea mexicana]|uniref:uncharacterized protein n=1 Tax=Zychaea mexicana TaxID=64656 RepID=UPI0022FF3B13|nr:uncharacterized protein BDB00DRAFT_941826 [Zychaea mexicana]KAI9489175.1 hypothetical protein BDB00DRAFT_941826 [Zychaea mexicana]